MPISPLETPTAPAAAPSRARSVLKNLILTALIVLNAALTIALTGWLAPPNAATAGSAVQGGRVSDYLIIPSRPLGLPQDVLYILDTDNARLAVAGYDPTTGRIDIVPPLDLRRGR